jgi:chemotaxis regulatin CheY-phosphate phosphatase CheZ
VRILHSAQKHKHHVKCLFHTLPTQLEAARERPLQMVVHLISKTAHRLLSAVQQAEPEMKQQ